MALDYVDYLGQLASTQRSAAEGPPAGLPSGATTQDTGMNTVPTATPTVAPSGFEDVGTLGKIGLALQGFGAGIKGEEPLFLKLRRQQMLEDQQRQETALKLAQMKQTQNNQQFDEAFKIALSDAPVEVREALLKDRAANGNTVASKMAPLVTKQVLSLANEETLKFLPQARRDDIAKLRDDPNHKVEGGWAAVEVDLKQAHTDWKEHRKSNAENARYSRIVEAVRQPNGWDSLPHDDAQFLIDFKAKQAKRDADLQLIKSQITASESDAAVKTATQETRIAEAAQQAAPQMRHRTIDKEGNVTFEQYDGIEGKWKPIPGSESVKVSPSVNIALGGEPKAMPPEQAARFAHFLEARQAARQLPSLVFDKQGNIKSQNLLTGAFPMGGLPFTEGRTLNQVIERGIQAKLRAETGAAAPENEVKNIAMRYKPALGDDKGQIQGKLKAFTDYIEDAIWLADPTGVHQGRAGTRKPAGSADTRGDELKKQHPDWTDYEVLARLQAEGY